MHTSHHGRAALRLVRGRASNRRRSKAGSPSKRRSRSQPPSTRSEPCRVLHIGAAIGLCRRKSSSGKTGRSDCTTASLSRAQSRARLGPKRGSIHRLIAPMATSQPNQPRRTLLLTGASRGIGHATVKRFSAAGWRVITCSRHPFPENCPWEAGPEDHIQVDLSDPENTAAAIAETKLRLNGELHALVKHDGISTKAAGGPRLRPAQ